MQTNDDHAKDYYYSPANDYDFTPNNHFARHHDNSTPDHDNSTPDHDHSPAVYHDFRRPKHNDDVKHNRTAWSAHECPACDDEFDFRAKHYDNGSLNASADSNHGPDAGIEPGAHGC